MKVIRKRKPDCRYSEKVSDGITFKEEKIQVPNRQAFIELIQDEIKERQLC